MSATLMLDVTVRLDRFTLAARWEAVGSFLGVFGPSGSGKTTLLESIAGLRRDARGLIRLGGVTLLDSSAGVDLPPERRGVGYVPQDALLFPHLDVGGNLLAGRRRAETTRRAAPAPARVLEVLELGPLGTRRAGTLSGGEKQRVALGRALCSGPDLLLLDEPLSGLDAPLKSRILPYLMRVHREFRIPTVYVSHDATEIRVLCDEMAVLQEGRVITIGEPRDVVAHPGVFPLARREGFENVLEGVVVSIEESAARVRVGEALDVLAPRDGLAAGERVVLGIRAEDLIVALDRPEGVSAQNVFPATVRAVHDPSADVPVEVVADPGGAVPPLIVAVTRQARRQLRLEPGAEVHLIAKVQSMHVLARLGR